MKSRVQKRQLDYLGGPTNDTDKHHRLQNPNMPSIESMSGYFKQVFAEPHQTPYRQQPIQVWSPKKMMRSTIDFNPAHSPYDRFKREPFQFSASASQDRLIGTQHQISHPILNMGGTFKQESRNKQAYRTYQLSQQRILRRPSVGKIHHQQVPVSVPMPKSVTLSKRYSAVDTHIKIENLFEQIETLRIQKEQCLLDTELEREKNNRLQQEFMEYNEHMQLLNEVDVERNLRMKNEQEVQLLKQEISDAQADALKSKENLRKAIEDQGAINEQNLKKMYRQTDTNVQQMEKLEDISKIILEQDKRIKDQDEEIKTLDDENRFLHNDIRDTRVAGGISAGYPDIGPGCFGSGPKTHEQKVVRQKMGLK